MRTPLKGSLLLAYGTFIAVFIGALPATAQGLVGSPVCPWIGSHGAVPDSLRALLANECRSAAIASFCLAFLCLVFARRKRIIGLETYSFCLGTLVGCIPLSICLVAIYFQGDFSQLAGWQGWTGFLSTRDYVASSIAAPTALCLLSCGPFGTLGLVLATPWTRSSGRRVKVLGCRKHFLLVARRFDPVEAPVRFSVQAVLGRCLMLSLVLWNFMGWLTDTHHSYSMTYPTWTGSEFVDSVLVAPDDPKFLLDALLCPFKRPDVR